MITQMATYMIYIVLLHGRTNARVVTAALGKSGTATEHTLDSVTCIALLSHDPMLTSRHAAVKMWLLSIAY